MTALRTVELARLDDDEATELEALLLDLTPARRAVWTVADRKGAPITRHQAAWEAPTNTRALELLDQLTTSATREARIGRPNGKSSTPAHARPLPYSDKPLDLLGQLAGVLVSWATATHRRDVAEWERVAKAAADAGRPQPAAPAPLAALNGPAAAELLLARLPALIRRPGTSRPELEQLRRLVRRARGMVDRPVDRFYAGPCSTPLRDDAGGLVIVDGEQAYCEEDLYARPGVPVVICRACTARHRVDSRRAELLRLARDRELRAVDLSRALTALGQPVTEDRVRQWKRRRLLGVASIDEAGKPLYRVGDVMDLLVADATRKPRQRKAPAA